MPDRININLLKSLLLLLLLVAGTAKSAQAGCFGVEQEDSLQLVALYEAMDGPNWTDNSQWTIGPVSEWYGITLTEDSCNVEEINLYYNQLQGELIDLQIPTLQRLKLDYNDIEGDVPNFGGIPALNYLNLTGNLLQGQLPDFDQLPNLEELYIEINDLTGTPPSFGNCPQLRVINLYDNHLVGPLPNFILPELLTLNLSTNDINGPIPDFNAMTSLQQLILFENNLTGPIPTFENNTQLWMIAMRINELSGSVPDFNLPLLTSLTLDRNQLDGTVPNFQNLPILQTLHIDNNQLTGHLPDFDNISQVTSFVVCPNNFSGPPPPLSDMVIMMQDQPWPPPGFPDCFSGAEFAGRAFQDDNGNCYFDEGETPLANVQIQVDGTYFTYTDSDGFYNINLDLGAHEITALPLNELWDYSCPGLEVISLTAQEYSDSFGDINFGFQALEYCSMLEVNLSNPLIRKCADTRFHLQYCNVGTSTAEEAFIEVKLPEEISVQEVSQDYTINGDTLLINLGDLPPAMCATIHIDGFVSCDAVGGATLCSQASIFPANNCTEPLEGWDLSNIIVDGHCTEDSIHFIIKNVGEAMSQPNVYRCYEDDILSALDLFMLGTGDSIIISRQADGSTFRLRAYQNEGHPFQSFSQEVIELCGNEGPWSLGMVNSQPAEDTPEYIHRHCGEVLASFDPNDKQVLPTGIDEENYISSDQELKFKIRFQNTGNDTAFLVKLVDTIDVQTLDISTLTTTMSSHEQHLNIIDGNIAEWTFENILLPDSTTNLIESQGFVEFSIRQNTGNDNGTVITNFADIYFDANEPVRTNSTLLTVCDDYGLEQFESLISIDNFNTSDEYLTEETMVSAEVNGATVSNTIALFSSTLQAGENNDFDLYLNFKNTANECEAAAGLFEEEIEFGQLSPGIYDLRIISNFLLSGGTSSEVFSFIVYPSNPSITEDSVGSICFEEQPDPITAIGDNIRWYGDSDLVNLLAEGNSYQPEAIEQTIFYTQTVNDLESQASSVQLRQATSPSFDTIQTICLNDEAPELALLSNNEEPISGTWIPSEINTTEAGVLNLTFFPDPEFCATETKLEVEIVELSVSITYAEEILAAYADSAISYDWYLNQELFLEDNPSISSPQPGDYFSIATDDNGCTAVSDIITIEGTSVTNEMTKDQELRIYPNPAVDYFSFDSGSQEPWKLRITNAQGLIITERLGSGSTTIHTKEWAKGIYYLSLLTGKKYWVKRILIL